MPWDGNQEVDPGTEEGELTPDEWEAMVADQKSHAGRHEDGGSDEINVAGLSGVLADAQTPQTEAVQDIVGALLQAGANISLTYDDANDTLTVDTSALNEEEVEDAVAALVTAGNAITVNYDDANDALSIAVDESGLSFYDGTNLTANVDNNSVTTEKQSIGDTTIDSVTLTIADDSVETVGVSGDATVHAHGKPEGNSSAFLLTQSNNILDALLSSRATNQGNTDLTGTTGPDGDLNFSRVGNILHVENRLGSEVDVEMLIYSA